MPAKTILVVDDSPTVRQQVRLALGPAGYDVTEAANGAEGLEKIASMAQIALVLCDVNMPRMTGLEMIRQIADANLRPGLPILMLTTERNPNLIRQAREVGVRGWIVKPFSANLLVGAVHKLTAKPTGAA